MTHIAQHRNAPAEITSGRGAAEVARPSLGPESEARSLASQFAASGSVFEPEAHLSARKIAADTDQDSTSESDEEMEEIDPPPDMAVATTASEDELQDANDYKGLPRDAHEVDGGPDGATLVGPNDPRAQDTSLAGGKGGPKAAATGAKEATGTKGAKGVPEGQQTAQEEGHEGEEAPETVNADGEQQVAPAGAPAQTPVATPAIQPVRFGVAKAADLGKVRFQEVVENRPDGTVVFVPEDSNELDREGGAAKPISQEEADAIKGERRAQAAAAIEAFSAAGEAKAASLDQYKVTVAGQLSAATNEGLGRVAAALEAHTVALRSAFDAARRGVLRNAAVATARVRASAATARSAVVTETTTRKAAVQTAAATATTEVAGYRTALQTQVAAAFTASAAHIRTAGATKGAAARSRGESRASSSMSPAAANGGFFEGKEYNRNKQRARAGAARDVAAAYQAEFVKKATETATALLAEQPKVTSGCADRITAASQQVTASKTAALGQIDASATASNAAITAALTQAETAISTQSTTNVATLRTAQTTQQRSLDSAARDARGRLAAQGRTLGETLDHQVSEASAQIRSQIGNVVTLSAGADYPDVNALHSALTATLADLDAMVAEIQGAVNGAVATQTGNLATQVQGMEQSFTQLVAQATQQAQGVSAAFQQSSSGLATATSEGMTTTATAHRTRSEGAATTATTAITTAKTGVQTDFSNIGTNLGSTLSKTEADFSAGLDASLSDMSATISSKADEAARKVQPAWKSVVKVLIAIVAAIIVAIVIAVLVASGVGLLVGCLIAAAVGAAVGVAKYMATQALMGEDITLMGALSEAASGAFGAVIGFVTAGAGAGLMTQLSGKFTGFATQFIGSTAAKLIAPALFNGFVSGVTETVGEVIKRAIDPDKDITWGAVLSAFGGGFLGGALGTFGPKLPIRRQTIKATEGLTRSLMPIAGRVAGNTNPLSNRVLGLGVKRVGEDILTSGAGEASKGTAGELGMNADASDNQSALQAAAQKDAQASVNRNVQLPNFSNLGQPAATTPAGQTPQPQNTPAPQTQGPQAPTTKKQP